MPKIATVYVTYIATFVAILDKIQRLAVTSCKLG